MTHPAWFTTSAAAALLRLNVKTVERACRAGTLTAERIGGTWRIPCTSLGLPMPKPVMPRRYTHDDLQLELPLPPSMLTPVKRYRNTGNPIVRDYGTEYGRKPSKGISG